ncbi:MAG: SH3 domain-containing protein [Anaerolineae bacterium]
MKDQLHSDSDNQPAGFAAFQRRQAVLIPFLVVVLTSLACGSFVPRPTPVPRPTATAIVEVAQPAGPTATATLDLPTSVPTREVETPTFTPTPAPGTAIIVGQPARVTATQGLNVRKSAGASGDRSGRFPPDAIVSVLEGPVDADGYRWWRVGNNELAGWVAEGDSEAVWLSPDLGSTQPVDRPVQLGDDVLVTVGETGVLSVRAEAGTSARVQHQVADKAQLRVIEGPVEANGYRWWKVSNESGNITGWAAEGSGDDRWLTPLE